MQKLCIEYKSRFKQGFVVDFQFKYFGIMQDKCGMKVGTDGVLLGAWALGGGKMLDIGTGTGLVALMMAQRFPQSVVDAIDIDEEACWQAMENVAASPFAERIYVRHSSLQDFHSSQPYDAIVSNPPFFVDSLKNPDSKRSLARHTDTLSFADLFAGAKRLLTEHGSLSIVVPTDVFGRIEEEACYKGFMLVRKCMVKTVERKAPKRILLTFSRCRDGNLEESTEVLQSQDGARSEWYARITEDFYVK